MFSNQNPHNFLWLIIIITNFLTINTRQHRPQPPLQPQNQREPISELRRERWECEREKERKLYFEKIVLHSESFLKQFSENKF